MTGARPDPAPDPARPGVDAAAPAPPDVDAAMPPLARSSVDRAAHLRTDPEWLAEAWLRCRVLVVDAAGRALCEGDAPAPGAPPRLVFTASRSAPDGERFFLGLDPEGTPYFAVVAELPTVPDTRPVTIRDVGAELSDRDTGLFLTAAALMHWHAAHRYAPATGARTLPAAGGWVREDDAGTQLFPRTDPAIIVLVHDGVPGPAGRCLLGANAAWPARGDGRKMFSTLAGFIEPGESAESAVVREVREEVGLTVSRLRYQGSQAWPFPASLMVGFTGYADPAVPLRLDPAEISAARWFTRTEIAALAADESGKVALPSPASIARHLIHLWLTARAGAGVL